MNKFIVILGAGRCGTTSLVSYLNKHPDFHIYGENNGTIITLLKSINLFQENKSYYKISSKFSTKEYKNIGSFTNVEWYNPPDKISFLENTIKNAIINFFDTNVKYTGFKEIRWSKNNIDSLNILENYFPIVKYIHLTRNIHDQYRSMEVSKWNLQISDVVETNNTIQEFLKNKNQNQYITKNISIDKSFLEDIYQFITTI